MQPATLIVVPCLNEEKHLDGVLTSLRADPGAENALIVVADGGSTDASRAIVQRHAAADPRVVLLDNERKLQSAAMNKAVQVHGGERPFVIRVDAHCSYPRGYCGLLLDAAAETGADCVVVSMRAVAEPSSCFQQAVAAAQNSVLGTGGSKHRKGGGRRWIDHGHHALFRTRTFRDAGGYDESFSHNEDAELDARIARIGGRILLAGDILIDYFPRRSAGPLLRQYFGYGKGRARMLRLHRQRPKLRQSLPFLVAPALVLALGSPIMPLAGVPALIWAGLCLGFGAALGLKQRNACAVVCGVPAGLMHAAWSAGLWWNLLSSPRFSHLGGRDS